MSMVIITWYCEAIHQVEISVWWLKRNSRLDIAGSVHVTETIREINKQFRLINNGI
jgi:hypothetical protein